LYCILEGFWQRLIWDLLLQGLDAVSISTTPFFFFQIPPAMAQGDIIPYDARAGFDESKAGYVPNIYDSGGHMPDLMRLIFIPDTIMASVAVVDYLF
jgi:hypothetical protein